MKEVGIVEVNSEIGAGTRGASLGIQAIKIASLNAKSTFFAEHSSLVVPNENHILFSQPKKSFAKNIASINKIFSKIIVSIKAVFESDCFPIVLAGDHSSAAGTIAGIKSTYPNKRLGVIWVDAHADLHSPYTTPSGNVHGMPLSIALAEDNLDKKRNDVPDNISKNWEQLKNIAGVVPNISYDDLVLIGVRDTEQEENYLIAKNNIKLVTVSEARIQGIAKTVKETNDYLKDCDLIYISFDVDSMDCTYVSHGTGTPVPVGFSEYEVTELLLGLLENEKVCCLEITEVNPTLDEKCNLMAETAFRVLEKTTKLIQNRKS